MARSLKFVLEGAGLVPVVAPVDVPRLPLAFWKPGFDETTLGSTELVPSGALADLTYFWMADCAPCLEGLRELARLDAKEDLRGVLGIRIVVVESDVAQFFGKDLVDSGWTRETLVDLNGGLAERLGVLGSPGVVVSDIESRVIARFNGDIAFHSPGFELFVGTLKILKEAKGSKENSNTISLASQLDADVKMTAEGGAKFLGVPVAGYFFLFALGVVCYAVAKSVMRRRKNFSNPTPKLSGAENQLDGPHGPDR